MKPLASACDPISYVHLSFVLKQSGPLRNLEPSGHLHKNKNVISHL